MPNYSTLNSEFAGTHDICKFCSKYSDDRIATRFLLIRSLDSEHLKDLLTEHTTETPKGKIEHLANLLYDSNITIDELLEYIEEKRQSLVQDRETELQGLDELLAQIPIVDCGVRNDNVSDIINAVVRNKSLTTLDELNTEIRDILLPRIVQYTLWSYYNQTANDFIELYLWKQPNIIPTLRRITNVDFFLNLDGEIIPFDLKVTHISDDYFDMFSQGLVRTENAADDFAVVQDGTSEINGIKTYYKDNKQALKLPNLGKKKKIEILTQLRETNNTKALAFIAKIVEDHAGYIPQIENNLHTLEWWNYKFQGEISVFCVQLSR